MDERARRRADWIEGVPIRMEDGETYHFPRPTVTFRMIPGGPLVPSPGAVETNRRFGEAFWRLSKAVDEALEAKDPAATYQAIGNLTADLLRRNYDLPDEALGEILVFIPADESNTETWLEVLAMSRGATAPKPAPAG